MTEKALDQSLISDRFKTRQAESTRGFFINKSVDWEIDKQFIGIKDSVYHNFKITNKSNKKMEFRLTYPENLIKFVEIMDSKLVVKSKESKTISFITSYSFQYNQDPFYCILKINRGNDEKKIVISNKEYISFNK